MSYSLLISFTFSFTFSRVFPFQWHSSHSAFPPRSLYREFVSACREFCRLVAISHHFGHLDLCDLSLGIARPPSPAGIPSALRAYPLCSARVSSGELAPGLTCLGCLVSCLRASTARLAGLAARGGCCCYHWPPLEAGLCHCLASAARGPLLRAVPRACCSPLRPGRPRP